MIIEILNGKDVSIVIRVIRKLAIFGGNGHSNSIRTLSSGMRGVRPKCVLYTF